MSTTIEYSTQLLSLLQVLWDKPQDQVHRRVVADCAEEEGLQELAECLRWMADNDKYPEQDCPTGPRDKKITWWWWHQALSKPRHSRIPNEDLPNTPASDWYATVQEAEEKLYQGWWQAKISNWTIKAKYEEVDE